MKILMAASECVPFVKVGGLADVVGTLPRFLKKKGNDVRIIIPKYRVIEEQKFNIKSLPIKLLIPVGNEYEEAVIWEGKMDDDLPVYFVESARYFNRREVYGTHDGDYADNRERFIFFSRAVLEAAKALNFQPDIIHCNDWQTAIIPAYLKTIYRIDGFFIRTASAYTIHNMAYQGNFDSDTVKIANFSWSDFAWDKLEYFGRFNFMKAGLVYADVLSTVSPSYAKEIQTKEGGCGLDGILRHRSGDISGILNGIDCAEWNPAKDTAIAANFSKDNVIGKQKCKENLQRTCGLAIDPGALLVGSVSRLDPQKGFDLVAKIIPNMVSKGIQFVILGRGDKSIQELLKRLSGDFRKRVSVHFEFNNALAHKIYAGSDVFAMPSRFEPCGISQMISLAYGTIPLVNKTGGLADTIRNFDAKTQVGNGFVFTPARSSQLRQAILRAKKLYEKKDMWKKLMRNGFASDFSWTKAVNKYIRLYNKAIGTSKQDR